MKQIFNRLKRFDTIFNRMIVSYVVLVLAVVLFIDAFLTVQFSINYNQKVEKLERNRLEQLKVISNNYLFEETNRMIKEITSLGNKDKEVQNFLNYPMNLDSYKAVELLEYLNVIANQNDSYVESIELYVPANNIWISTLTGINYTDEDADAFLLSLDIFELETKYQESKRWLAKRVMNYGNRTIPVFSFTAGYPLYTEDQSKLKGYIIINISQEVIHNLLKDFLNGELDSIAIMNLQGDIVAIEGEKDGFDTFLDNNKDFVTDLLSKNEDQEVYKVADYIITSQAIGITDWKIMKLMSTKEYYDETRAIQIKGLYFSLIVLTIGIILSYRFAKALYKPFYLIMNKLKKAKLNKKARESEYYYIDRAIEELYDLAIVKEEVLLNNMNIIQHDFVVNLLSGRFVDRRVIDDKLEFFGYKENWQTKHLLMIKLHQRIYEHLDELTRNLITYNMIQFFENYAFGSMRCLSADMFEGKICVIIFTQEDGKEQLEMLRRKFVDYMKINFSVDPIILQSRMFSDLKDGNKAYNALLKVLEYIYFMPHTYFIDCEILEDQLSDQSNVLNPDFEAFCEALVTRNLEQIKKVLKNFIEEPNILAASIEKLNSILLKYVFLYNYFLRDMMKEINGEQDTKLFKNIYDMYDIEDFYFQFVQLIENTFADLSKMENNPTITVVKLIEKVIMEYLDDNLSLEFIAEKVYLSPKYISRIFKEEKGINITQFITDCKLKKAAKLLIETNISLDELIKQIGFSSTNYFIKKFKEKYSITPVQYRRNSIM